MSDYDRAVLIEQLEAVRRLPTSDQRIMGDVLTEYGRILIESADNLERLQEFVEAYGVR